MDLSVLFQLFHFFFFFFFTTSPIPTKPTFLWNLFCGGIWKENGWWWNLLKRGTTASLDCQLDSWHESLSGISIQFLHFYFPPFPPLLITQSSLSSFFIRFLSSFLLKELDFQLIIMGRCAYICRNVSTDPC